MHHVNLVNPVNLRNLIELRFMPVGRLYDNFALFNIDFEAGSRLPQTGDRQLNILIYVTLQKARTVGRVETTLGQAVYRRLGYFN